MNIQTKRKELSAAVLGPANTGKSTFISILAKEENMLKAAIAQDGPDTTLVPTRYIFTRDAIEDGKSFKVELQFDSSVNINRDELNEQNNQLNSGEDLTTIVQRIATDEYYDKKGSLSIWMEMSEFAKQAVPADITDFIVYDTKGSSVTIKPDIPPADKFIVTLINGSKEQTAEAYNKVLPYLTNDNVIYLYKSGLHHNDSVEDIIDYEEEYLEGLKNASEKIIGGLFESIGDAAKYVYNVEPNTIQYPLIPKRTSKQTTSDLLFKGAPTIVKFKDDLKKALSVKTTILGFIDHASEVLNEEEKELFTSMVVEALELELKDSVNPYTEKELDNFFKYSKGRTFSYDTNGADTIGKRVSLKARAELFDKGVAVCATQGNLKVRDLFAKTFLRLINHNILYSNGGHSSDYTPRYAQAVYSSLYGPLSKNINELPSFMNNISRMEQKTWGYTFSPYDTLTSEIFNAMHLVYTEEQYPRPDLTGMSVDEVVYTLKYKLPLYYLITLRLAKKSIIHQ